MKKIGIIGAFDEEIEKLVEFLKLDKINGLKEIHVGNYKDLFIVLANSNIGKVNSALTTQYLIDKYDIDIIINTGCAGSLTSEVGIMELVIANVVSYHDFYPKRVAEFSVPDQGNIKADKDLINKFISIIPSDIKYYIAPITTGDCYVTDANLRDKIKAETNAICVDMESASIGHVAKVNNIPFLNIRTISDFSDGAADLEMKAAYQSSLLVKDFLDIL